MTRHAILCLLDYHLSRCVYYALDTSSFLVFYDVIYDSSTIIRSQSECIWCTIRCSCSCFPFSLLFSVFLHLSAITDHIKQKKVKIISPQSLLSELDFLYSCCDDLSHLWRMKMFSKGQMLHAMLLSYESWKKQNVCPWDTSYPTCNIFSKSAGYS